MIRTYSVALHHHGHIAASRQTCETPEEALAEHIAQRSPTDGDHEVLVTLDRVTVLGCIVTLRRGVVQAVTPRHLAAA